MPLAAAVRGIGVPAEPGLYRLRRRSASLLAYIGQTGSGTMTLRKRMAMLRGVFGPEMPYRDPHTAGPALWAMRHQGHDDLEASFAVVAGDTPWRKGLEAVALAEHRQGHRCSPSVNFGRMPKGYRMSSANNALIVAAGRRFRGTVIDDDNPSHLAGVPPAGPLDRSVTAEDWCGHWWTSWRLATAALEEPRAGLYRLRGHGRQGLVYVGEGVIVDRVRAHVAKMRAPGHAQGRVLALVAPLEISWVEGTWEHHQRLELENDLIAAHVLVEGRPPLAQFLG
ncbi:MAG: hypothetical protein EPO40_17545 [Myxococcaceae bacterium]|nr:MAG: hypothetical protein EPO40_17545 [Myxococcaceae bacterium]